MEKHHKVGHKQRLGVFWLISLSIIFIASGVANAAPQYNLACNSCHGMPPLDSSTRDINSGGFVGNHDTHLPATAVATDCTRCHANSGYTTSHRNGQVEFSANINNSPTAAQLNVNGTPVTFTNQTTVPAPANCSNVNCHFNATTPTWGSAALVSPAGCSTCHAAPPADGGHPSLTGPGAKHGAYYGTGTGSCVKCHPDHTVEAKPFAHATSAGDRALQLAFTTAPNAGVGSPAYSLTSDLAYPTYLTASSRNGSCSNLYCHSDGTKASTGTLTTNVAPTWGGSLTCAGCHKADGVASLAIATGTHTKHVASDSGYGFSCVKCHSVTATSSSSVNIAAGNHVNGLVNVAFNNSSTAVNGRYNNALSPMTKAVGSATGYCSNVYCHSDGTKTSGTFTVMSSPKWGGTLPTNCTGCHGGDYTAAANRQMVTNKHAQHINNTLGGSPLRFACGECHAKTVSTTSNQTIVTKANHVNHFVDFSGARAPKSALDASKNCSTVYCHSNGKGAYKTVSWTAASTALTCTGCHDVSASLGHPNHLALSGVSCNNCHANTAASATALVSGTTTHINGTYNVSGQDISFSGLNAAGTYNSSAKTCSTVYCHSNGKGTYTTTPTWGSVATCTTCHPTLSGAHQAHTGNLINTVAFYNFTSNLSSGSELTANTYYAFGCSNCHPTDLSKHADGIIEVEVTNAPAAGETAFSTLRSKNSATATANVIASGSNVTCSGVYCHSNGQATPTYVTTPNWYGGVFAGDKCAGCHGNSPTSGAHAAHVVGIHSDDVFNGATGTLPTGGAVGVSAGHGDPAQSTTLSCNICHNATINVGYNDQNTACATCHASDPKGNAVITNRAMHINGRVDLSFYTGAAIKTKAQIRDASFASYTAAGGYWTRTTYKAGAGSYDTAKLVLNNSMYSAGTCSNIACHNGKPANWTTDVGKAAQCTLCHTNL